MEVKILNTVGATVLIDGVERESVVVDAGTTVHWKVSKEGYVTQEGDHEVKEDTVLPVSLKRTAERTITFVVSPASGSVLTVNGEVLALLETGQVGVSAHDGEVLEWSCECEGHVTQSGTHTVDGDDEIDIVLEAEQFTFKIEATPGDATVTINGELTDSVTVDYGSTVKWEVSREGYVTQSGSEVVTEDRTLKVSLEETPYLTVSPESLDFTSEGGSAAVRVSCSEDWTAEIASLGYGRVSSGLSISKDSGAAGETDIEITADEYSSTTYGRSWTVLITSVSGLTAAVAVSQSAASGDDSGDSGGQVGGGGLISQQYTLTIRCVLNSGAGTDDQLGGGSGGLVTIPTLRLTVDGSSGTRTMAAVSDTEYTYSEAFDEGTVVTYELSASGFSSASGTVTMDQDRSVSVTLRSN